MRNKGGVVSHADIASTKTDGWLTDVVIYEFMNEMCEDWQQNGKHGVRVGVMRSHFMTKYMRKGYEGVKGWCKKALGGENIIDRDIVFVPVHCGGNHWCLCVLHRDRYKDGQYQLYFFDSIEASREESKERYAGALLNYVHEEYADRRNSGLSEGELHVEIVTVKVPPQRDNSSCGVFVLYYVEQILKHDSVRKMIVSLDCGDIINVAAQRFRVKEAMIKMHRRNGDCKHGSTCIYRRDVIVIE